MCISRGNRNTCYGSCIDHSERECNVWLSLLSSKTEKHEILLLLLHASLVPRLSQNTNMYHGESLVLSYISMT